MQLFSHLREFFCKLRRESLVPDYDFTVSDRISLLERKNPFPLFGRMSSPVDNLGRHISFCSEGLSASLLLLGIVCLLGYPLIHCVTQGIIQNGVEPTGVRM